MSRQGRTGRLSAHFTAAEFACPHCNVALVRDDLLAVLERIRSRTATPLHIVSGYRCPVHNTQINGAANSMHMYGAAADLAPGSCTIAIARSAGAVGVGTKGQWVLHVDVRDGAPASWVYT